MPPLLIALLASTALGASPAERCSPMPPPPTISAEARAILSAPDGRAFLPAAPTTPESWRTLQAEYEAAGAAYVAEALKTHPADIVREVLGSASVLTVVPEGVSAQTGPVVLNLHGGGYALNGGMASLYTAIPLADALGVPVVSVDYRMPPDHPFPAAVEDAVAAYRALLETRAPEQIAIYGLSAGGGLAAATTLAIREAGLPLPSGVAMNSPWADLAEVGDSGITLLCQDPVLPGTDGVIEALAAFYAGEASLDDPLVSPVHGDYAEGFPPALLVTGTRDIMLSNTVRLHQAMRQAGADADLLVFEGMWHAFWGVPEADDAFSAITAFLRERLALTADTAITEASHD